MTPDPGRLVHILDLVAVPATNGGATLRAAGIRKAPKELFNPTSFDGQWDR